MKKMLTLSNYKIEYYPFGLLAIILITIPNIGYYFFTPAHDVLSGNEASFWLWNTLENIGRIGIMLTLGLVVNKVTILKHQTITIVIFCSLILYYMLWSFYFVGMYSGLSLVGMAVLPSLFFILISWRQQNGYALAFSSLFAIMHITITSSNFLFM